MCLPPQRISKSSIFTSLFKLHPFISSSQIRELELELAQTKLQLVESQCTVQDLEHKLNSSMSELHSARNNSWLQKTFSSLKDATTAGKKE